MFGVLEQQQEAGKWSGKKNLEEEEDLRGRAGCPGWAVDMLTRSRWLSVGSTWVLGHSSQCIVAIFFLYGEAIADPLTPPRPLLSLASC